MSHKSNHLPDPLDVMSRAKDRRKVIEQEEEERRKVFRDKFDEGFDKSIDKAVEEENEVALRELSAFNTVRSAAVSADQLKMVLAAAHGVHYEKAPLLNALLFAYKHEL